MREPVIIQGGMGIAVSGWPLARAVSLLGQLGVVSGTALDAVFVRRLQQGDPGGHLRRALAQFPVPETAQRILKRYLLPEGKSPEAPFALVPMWTIAPDAARQELAVVANFAEVFLAKEGHGGVVGINFLEKIQLPMLPSLYGALLAGVDYVLMGAGIPREIPGALDRLARHEDAALKVTVEGAAAEDDFRTEFSPRAIVPNGLRPLKRPKFLAIIASSTLAMALLKKPTGRIDGFVIEGPLAGGHNAPPRGPLRLSEVGEPVYGPRDEVDLEILRQLGLPFWLAGSYGSPEQLQRALQAGAAGVQVGTAFAFCSESGIAEEIKSFLIRKARHGEGSVFTDPRVSPAGFPFKVVRMEGSLSESEVYEERPRLCDLGYLRSPYKRPDGTLGYRCPGEPVDAYLQKGGKIEETAGRKCLCNGLMATVGFAQWQRTGYLEPPLVTAGDDFKEFVRLFKPDQATYSAAEVVEYLLGPGGSSR